MKGLISGTIDWVTHASYSEGTTGEWAAGLVIVLIIAFLWSTVVKQVIS